MGVRSSIIVSSFLQLALATTLVLVASCSAFESGDPQRTGESDAGSAELDGSRPPSDASGPSTADSGTEVSLLNGDFELGCTAWTVIGEPKESDIARTGKACRICGSADNSFASISQKTNVTVPVGSMFAAEIWYRADPSQPASTGPSALLHTYASGILATESGQASTGEAPTTSDWASVIALMAPTKEATAVLFEVTFQLMGGTCIIVDDARIVRTR